MYPLRTLSRYPEGLVQEEGLPRDGRSQLVTLTDEGKQAMTAAFPAFFETMAEVEQHLSHATEEVQAALDDLEQAFRTVREKRLERDRAATS